MEYIGWWEWSISDGGNEEVMDATTCASTAARNVIGGKIGE